jgi:hypothetical protein
LEDGFSLTEDGTSNPFAKAQVDKTDLNEFTFIKFKKLIQEQKIMSNHQIE